MIHLTDNFKNGTPISAIGAAWFNAVAWFINNLMGVGGVHVNRDGAFPTIYVNVAELLEPTDTEPSPINGANISADAAGQTYLNQTAAVNALAPLRSTWERDGEHGIKLTVCAGAVQLAGNITHASFADLYFDEHGLLFKVETARNAFHMS